MPFCISGHVGIRLSLLLPAPRGLTLPGMPPHPVCLAWPAPMMLSPALGPHPHAMLLPQMPALLVVRRVLALTDAAAAYTLARLAVLQLRLYLLQP